MCRLDGSYGRETANSAAVAEVASTSLQHLASMQMALQSAIEAQQQRSASVTAALDTFAQKNVSDIALLQVPDHQRSCST